MNKNINTISQSNISSQNVSQNITIESRKSISISGVNKIITLNPNEFEIVTTLGNLKITGENMEMKNFDIEKGNMYIVGTFDSLLYFNIDKTKKNKSFIQKLFK